MQTAEQCIRHEKRCPLWNLWIYICSDKTCSNYSQMHKFYTLQLPYWVSSSLSNANCSIYQWGELKRGAGGISVCLCPGVSEGINTRLLNKMETKRISFISANANKQAQCAIFLESIFYLKEIQPTGYWIHQSFLLSLKNKKIVFALLVDSCSPFREAFVLQGVGVGMAFAREEVPSLNA